MNRILINSAAAINIAAAALIYIACSGDDGKDGSVCTGVQTASGVNIVCDGQTVGTVNNGQDAPGAAGTCTVLPPGADGSLNANCGGQTYPLGGAGGGGCSISDGDAYYILTCGTTPMQIAKGWCAGVPYNPAKQACGSDGTISENRCGNDPIDLDRQFCSSNKIYTLCGVWTVKPGVTATKLDDYVVTGAKEYNPLTEFCAWNIYTPTANFTSTSVVARIDTVYKRCGVTLTTAPNPVLTSASTLPPNTGGTPVPYLETPVAGDGTFDPKASFCYTSTTGDLAVKLRCGTTPLPSDPGTISAGLSYSSNEMCVSSSNTPNNDNVDGTVSGTCDSKSYEADKQFCYKGLTIYTKCDTSSTTATAFVSFDPETQFCSPTIATTFTTLTPGTGHPLNNKKVGYKGKILPLCGLVTKTTNGGRRAYHSAFEFCQGEGALAKIITLCNTGLQIGTDDPAWEPVVYSDGSDGVKDLTTDVFDASFSGAIDNIPYPAYLDHTVAASLNGAITVSTAAAVAADEGKFSLKSNAPGSTFDPNINFCGIYKTEQKILQKCGGAEYDDGEYCDAGVKKDFETCKSTKDYSPLEGFCDRRLGGAGVNANNVLYKIVKIGNYTWFADNLNYRGPNSPPDIGKQYGLTNLPTPVTLPSKAQYAAAYGVLYSATEAATVCPTDWRLPGDAEWTNLSNTVGAGNAAKLRSATGINIQTGSTSPFGSIPGSWAALGTDDFGFNGVPAGKGVYTPDYVPPANSTPTIDNEEILYTQARSQAYWWSSAPSSSPSTLAKYKSLAFDKLDLLDGEGNVFTDFYSVRCVK